MQRLEENSSKSYVWKNSYTQVYKENLKQAKDLICISPKMIYE